MECFDTTVRQDQSGQWYYVSFDPFVDGQPVGEIRPQWVDEAIAKAEAETQESESPSEEGQIGAI